MNYKVRQDLAKKSLDQLADWMSDTGNNNQITARAEFLRRQTKANEDAAKAQTRSAWFQLAAVIAMFLAVLATLAAPWLARYVAGK